MKSKEKKVTRVERRKRIEVHVVARVTRFSRAVERRDTKVRGGARREEGKLG